MSTLYGVNYTKYNTGPTENNIQARGAVSGKLSYLRDTYEAAATTAGDVVYIGHPLNDGDRIQGFLFSCDDNTGGTTATVNIGDASTSGASRYADGIAVDAGAVSGNKAILVDGMDYVIGTADDDNIIQLTLADDVFTGTLKLTILYSRV